MPFVANQQLLASQLNALQAFARPLIAVKSSDESIASSTTMQDDNELFIPVAANASYRLNMHLLVFSTATTGDIAFRFNAPAGSRMSASSAGLETGATGVTGQMNAGAIQDVTTFPTAPLFAFGTHAGVAGVIGVGTLIVGGIAGRLHMQWSQATASAAATILKAGSSMELTRYA